MATVDNPKLQAALEAGEARTLGDLPDSAVAYRDGYWVPVDTGWLEVEDESTVAFLADAERRLRLADEVIERKGQS